MTEAAVCYLASVAGIAVGLIEGHGKFHGRLAALLFLVAFASGTVMAISVL